MLLYSCCYIRIYIYAYMCIYMYEARLLVEFGDLRRKHPPATCQSSRTQNSPQLPLNIRKCFRLHIPRLPHTRTLLRLFHRHPLSRMPFFRSRG